MTMTFNGSGTITGLVAGGLPDASVTAADLASSAALTNIGSGGVTATYLATAVTPIGVSQTWTDVTASRAIGTTYTNSTGRPITVIVAGTGGGANGLWGVSFGSGAVYYTPSTYTSGAWTSTAFIVPNGETYALSQQGANATLSKWLELR